MNCIHIYHKYVIIQSFICSPKFDSLAIMNMSAGARNFPQTLNIKQCILKYEYRLLWLNCACVSIDKFI